MYKNKYKNEIIIFSKIKINKMFLLLTETKVETHFQPLK